METPGQKLQHLVVALKEAAKAEEGGGVNNNNNSAGGGGGNAQRLLLTLEEINGELEDLDQTTVMVSLGGLPVVLGLCRHPWTELQLQALIAVQMILKVCLSCACVWLARPDWRASEEQRARESGGCKVGRAAVPDGGAAVAQRDRSAAEGAGSRGGAHRPRASAGGGAALCCVLACSRLRCRSRL